jgi:hypothetical protein
MYANTLGWSLDLWAPLPIHKRPAWQPTWTEASYISVAAIAEKEEQDR